MEALRPGQRFGAYRILQSLGEGGMGCVYEAEHIELKVRRALKVFSSDSEYAGILRKKFVQEGRMLADLRHPRIVRVYDFALDDETGTPYFAMDLVVSPSGGPRTLEAVCKGGVDEDQVAGWFRDICEGLAYIHSKGVVHRDVALDNILIDADGHAVLTDFGIARITGETYRRRIDVTVTMPLPTGEKLCMGKGLYMAPELQSGTPATPASDAYAVGVLLFRLLAGSWYTPDTRLEDSLAGLDYNWATVIGRLCAKDPASRLPVGSIAEMSAILQRAAVSPDPPRSNVWRVMSVFLTLTVVGLGAFLFQRRGRDAPEVGKANVKEPHSGALTAIHSPVIHVVNVTNVVRETVYQVVPVTNRLQKSSRKVKVKTFRAADSQRIEREWKYAETSGGVRVTGLTDSAARSKEDGARQLEIPEEIAGKRVVAIGRDAFSLYQSLRTVKIPASVTEIGARAFSGCGDLEEIVLPLALEKIDDDAFSRCESLETVHIPARVKKIGRHAFGNCRRLTSIDVAAGNKAYASVGGVLLDRAKRYVMCVPGGLASVELPQSVRVIEAGAFEGCARLKGVIIPEGVTKLKVGLFDDCENLETVVIPKSVREIAGAIFSGCGNLARVVFLGDAPDMSGDAGPFYEKAAREATTYVVRGSSGWGHAIPGTWQGRPIAYSPGR